MTITFPASDLDLVCLSDADENKAAPNAFENYLDRNGDIRSDPNVETNYRGQFVIIDGSVYRVVRVQDEA